MPSTKEEMRTAVKEFVNDAIEESRTSAIKLVEHLLVSSSSSMAGSVFSAMTPFEAINFGRTLHDGWELENAGNAKRISAQKAVLAKILTAVITSGMLSLTGLE